MNRSLVDTDIISYFLRGDESVAKKVIEYSRQFDKISVSIVTYYELLGGLEFKAAERQKEQFLRFIRQRCEILNLSRASIDISAREYGRLRKEGITVGNADLFIAGTAILEGLELVTNNTSHYKVIKGLKLSNWKT